MTKRSDTEAEQVLLDRLPPRRRSWVLSCFLVVAVAAIMWALLKLTGQEALSWVLVVVTVAMVAGAMVFGLRADRRAEILDAFIESTWRRLGWKAPHRSMVKHTSWTGGWVGFPSKLQLRYASSIDDADPGFSAMVLENAERRFGQTYRVVPRSASLWRPKRAGHLMLAQRDQEDSTRDEWEDKTERFVHQLLGASAKVATTMKDGTPATIEVEHSMGAKVAPSGYRQRLERTIFAMVPGRWRAHWDLSAERVRFELRPDLPSMVPHEPQPLPDAVDTYGRYRNFTVAVGVDEDGRHVYWEPIINAHGLVTGGTGKGKALALSTNIPTPTGSARMGDLRVGSKVLGRDGRPCTVTAVFDVASPTLYRVTLSDGQQVIADGNHQWVVSRFHHRRIPANEKRKRSIATATAREEHSQWLLAIASQYEPDEFSTWAQLGSLVLPLGAWKDETALRSALKMVDIVGRKMPAHGGFQVVPTGAALRGLAARLQQMNENVRTLEIGEEVLSTEEMLAVGIRGQGGRAEFSIKTATAWQLPEAELRIDPYVLGVWLGDGTCRKSIVTTSESDLPSLLQEFEGGGFVEHSRAAPTAPTTIEVGFVEASTGQSLHACLKQAGLQADGAKLDKRVPPEYLRSSREQRLAVLQGLMDADGGITEAGQCELTLCKSDLAADALELIRSLGIKATVKISPAQLTEADPDRPGEKRRRVTGNRHRIKFTTDIPVFRLARKSVRLPSSLRPTQTMLYIKDIEQLAREDAAYEPARCITVNSDDSTYLVEGSIPTHNTALLHTLTTALCRADFRVWILDGKRIEFLGFRDWPNVELVASRIEHQVRMLLAAHDEMERRYALIEEGKARLSDFEPLFVIIDEYATFKENATQWYSEVREKSDPTKPAVFARMANIARLGRKAAIHMVVGLQRPDVEFLGGEMRDNFGWRFSLGRLSPQGANMMWESYVIGVTLPTKTRGRGITLDARGEPVEALALYTPDPGEPLSDSQQEQIDALHPAKVTWPRKTFADPDPNLDDDDGESVPVYSDYAQLRLVSFETVQAQRSVQMVEEEAELIVSRAAAENQDEATAEVDDEDLFAEYGPVDEQRPSELQPGQLVLVDPDLDMWGVVSHEPEPDMTDSELLLIEYLDFETGEEGGISVALSERVQYRVPKEES